MRIYKDIEIYENLKDFWDGYIQNIMKETHSYENINIEESPHVFINRTIILESSDKIKIS